MSFSNDDKIAMYEREIAYHVKELKNVNTINKRLFTAANQQDDIHNTLCDTIAIRSEECKQITASNILLSNSVHSLAEQNSLLSKANAKLLSMNAELAEQNAKIFGVKIHQLQVVQTPVTASEEQENVAQLAEGHTLEVHQTQPQTQSAIYPIQKKAVEEVYAHINELLPCSATDLLTRVNVSMPLMDRTFTKLGEVQTTGKFVEQVKQRLPTPETGGVNRQTSWLPLLPLLTPKEHTALSSPDDMKHELYWKVRNDLQDAQDKKTVPINMSPCVVDEGAISINTVNTTTNRTTVTPKDIILAGGYRDYGVYIEDVFGQPDIKTVSINMSPSVVDEGAISINTVNATTNRTTVTPKDIILAGSYRDYGVWIEDVVD